MRWLSLITYRARPNLHPEGVKTVDAWIDLRQASISIISSFAFKVGTSAWRHPTTVLSKRLIVERATRGVMSEIVPVILCGGVGSRLWPLSRKSLPKQFAQLLGDKSLFAAAIKRVDNEKFAATITHLSQISHCSLIR